jgi:hypothetical protein
MKSLPPLLGVIAMGAPPGLTPGANFGLSLRDNVACDFASELIIQETSGYSSAPARGIADGHGFGIHAGRRDAAGKLRSHPGFGPS